MARSTSELRVLWGPPCNTANMVTIPFGKNGARITVDRRTVEAFNELAAVMAKYNYAITPPDVGAYNCRQITGGTGYSLHAYGIAADVNWQDNPYGPVLRTNMPSAMIEEIRSIVTNNRVPVFRWGGDYSGNKDAMHFEVVASPAELAAGIAGGAGQPLSAKEKLYWFLWAGREAKKKPFLTMGSEKDPKLVPYIKQVQRALGINQTGEYGVGTHNKVKAFQKFLNIKPKRHYGNMNKITWQWLIYDVYTRGRR